MRAGALLLAVAALAGCGSQSPRSPEQVARAWSAALDRGDDAAAAGLFAPGARVIQSGVLVLGDRKAARDWNAALPCGGKILSVQQQEDAQAVLVVFRLTERPGHACDGPGQTAAAVFRVVDGQITLWHQVPPPTPGQSV